MTKKPYYRLIVGSKPYHTADMRFGCERVRIDVGADAPCGTSAALFDTRWRPLLEKVWAFLATDPGVSVSLTEPSDRPLRAEVVSFKQAKETTP